MKTVRISLIVATMLAGCARTPTTINVSVTETPSDKTAASTPPVSPPSGTAYPETSDVEALLYRARVLQQKGQFQSALSLVNQALQHDPHSPSATAMKKDLDEIIKRL